LALCNAKAEAARGLLEEFEDEIKEASVVGVGTGSTTALALREAQRRGLLRGKQIVVSSMATALLASELGLKPLMPNVVDSVDIYFDGADEVVPSTLDMIKGRGAALLGEKILAYNSRVRIYVVDESKIVDRLGSKKPLPIEVVPWALGFVLRELGKRGLEASPREGSGKDGPVVSDWGGVIVDISTGPIEDPRRLEAELHSIPGVVETGLFLGLADAVVVGKKSCGYEVLRSGGRG